MLLLATFVRVFILFRAPRFLLQQSLKAQPEKNPLYQQQKVMNHQQRRNGEVYPNPPTISMLPLRPKSCMPRLTEDEKPKIQITEAFEPTEVSKRFDPNN